MTAQSTPEGISPTAARQLTMLAEALLGVAEEELLASSVEGAGRVAALATGYPTSERPSLEESGGGMTQLGPSRAGAALSPSGFVEPRLPSAQSAGVPPPEAAPGPLSRPGSRRTVGLRPTGTKTRAASPEFLPRPLLPGSHERDSWASLKGGTP